MVFLDDEDGGIPGRTTTALISTDQAKNSKLFVLLFDSIENATACKTVSYWSFMSRDFITMTTL